MTSHKQMVSDADKDDALRSFSDKETVHYAMSLLLGVTDPEALPTLAYAANRIKQYSDDLIRASFERECG